MKRKTAEEKEKIVKEVEKIGIIEGCRKYGISATTYYDWERKYKVNGLKGLSAYNVRSDKDYKRIEKENAQLKELLIAKELQILLQGELLKKKMEQWKTKEK
jgi:transposase-like protein